MSAQHTPGPWRVVEPQADGFWGILAADRYPVAVLATGRYPALANVRLLAVAPEMYEVVKAYATDERCQAIIAKIEGGQP